MKKEMLKKEADKIDELIAKGHLKEEELPLLVREGLSQETVDYWKSRQHKTLFAKIVDFLRG
jgi:hypothetical protein